MLTVDQIRARTLPVVRLYDVTSLSLFGSYAKGTATQSSDVDLLVEFSTRYVSLIKLSGLKLALEESLGTSVDVIHAPIPNDSLLDVQEVIALYASDEEAGRDDPTKDMLLNRRLQKC